MEQTIASAPTDANESFAGLLASLTAPKEHSGERSSSEQRKAMAAAGKSSFPARKSASAWDDEDLAEDVATLSYERALQAHGRYKPVEADSFEPASPAFPDSLTELASKGGQAFADFKESASNRLSDGFPEALAAVTQLAAEVSASHKAGKQNAVAASETIAAAEPDRAPATQLARNLKAASVTIRLSKEECEQLHRRAAEAGLTVSAYLRSCTFEAESLRAMVKDTLAELRSVKSERRPVAVAAATAIAPVERRPSLFRRFGAWLIGRGPRWQGAQRIARA
jgi:hypothetical protein